MTFSKEPSFPNSFSLPSLPCFSKTAPFLWPRPWQPPKPSYSAKSVLLWGPWHRCCWSIPEATKGLLQRCHHWWKTNGGQKIRIQSWVAAGSLKVVFCLSFLFWTDCFWQKAFHHLKENFSTKSPDHCGSRLSHEITSKPKSGFSPSINDLHKGLVLTSLLDLTKRIGFSPIFLKSLKKQLLVKKCRKCSRKNGWYTSIYIYIISYWKTTLLGTNILLMEEILHQLIGSLSHYLEGFIHPRWCKISSINSIPSQGTFESMIFRTSLSVGYVIVPLRVTFVEEVEFEVTGRGIYLGLDLSASHGIFHPAVSGHKRNRGGDGIQQATA